MKITEAKVEIEDNGLVWGAEGERLRVEPWGTDSVRVRSANPQRFKELPGALLPPFPVTAQIELRGDQGVLINGKLRVELSRQGQLRFFQSITGKILLEEPLREILMPSGREYKSLGSDLNRIDVRFQSREDEGFYGLGQHRHGRLNQKGCVLDLAQRNCEISIPFLLSSRGYGFLWHHPGTGRVELGHTVTRWVADASQGVDYWITAGDSPADILENYANATGHPPMLPEWASGFWQSKLRYKTQEELLQVARAYRDRGLPLSVIVIDFFHWPMMGDMVFDPEFWPDPAAMVAELKSMGIKVMISVWPSFNGDSSNFEEFKRRGLLLRTERGTPALFPFFDTSPEGLVYLHYYDPSNPEARTVFWEKVRDGYLKYGIDVFWLDACEPEMNPIDCDNLKFYIGNGAEVACLYPFLHQQAIAEGMQAAGQEQSVFLCRSAWAGSQRFGAAVWSGDIKSTFEVLTLQVRAGLNMALSGIPWWTTDIGGFHSGDPTTPYFRELIVRWFQYGVFCPLFRLHGVRLPAEDKCGSDNEVWSFGEEAYALIKEQLFLRERLRPYLMEQMKVAKTKGLPPMRPLLVDFPSDARAWEVEDQFMLGPDLLIAPVTELGLRNRRVYLPQGETWVDAWSGESVAGGAEYEGDSPLSRIPVFLRAGAAGKKLDGLFFEGKRTA